MWLKHSAFKASVSVVLSAMMALPVPALAKFGNDEIAPAAKDGPPVIYEEIPTGDGQVATHIVVPYTRDQEAELIDKLARVNPDGFHLGVASDQDEALKTAAKTGFFNRIKTYIVGNEEQLPLMQTAKLSAGGRERLKAKMKALTTACKDSWVGLVSAISYSGINGTSVWMTSASVPAGSAIFSAISLWNAFVLLKPEAWGAMIRKGANAGNKLAEAIGNYYGVQISEIDRRVLSLVGKFAVTTTVGMIQVGLIRAFEGEMAFLSRGWEGAFEDLAYITLHAVMNNYSIWDDVVIERYREGKMQKQGVNNYLAAQYFLGGMLELGSYQGFHASSWILMGLTFSGVLYQLLNVDQQHKLSSAPAKLNVTLRNGFLKVSDRQSLISRRIGSIRSRVAKVQRLNKTNCEKLLETNRAKAAVGGQLWEDTQ